LNNEHAAIKYICQGIVVERVVRYRASRIRDIFAIARSKLEFSGRVKVDSSRIHATICEVNAARATRNVATPFSASRIIVDRIVAWTALRVLRAHSVCHIQRLILGENARLLR